MTEAPSKFQQKLAERRKAAEEAATAAAASRASHPSFDDTVPEPEFERSKEDVELDKFVESLDIIDAYNRWCGKMVPETRPGQTEGIKISCPIPGHRDSNPSAWINTDKQTWFCATCSVGGDAYDLAAYHFGYPVPGYKDGPRFHDLRRDMARSYGYTFLKPPGVTTPIPVAPSVAVDSADSPEGSTPDGPGDKADELLPDDGGNVVSINHGDGEPDVLELPTLDWRPLVTSDTFLDEYMKVCCKDDVPEEYHFWNGLLALGLAVGREITLADSRPVYANLFICVLGNTGQGKSKSYHHLKSLIKKTLPFKAGDPTNKGVEVVSSPASPEYLIQSFSKPVYDPINPKTVAYYAPVRGLVYFNELAALVARNERKGSAMKPTLMEFYDGDSEITSGALTTGKKEAHEAFGSCFTTTQPKSIRDLVTAVDAGSGFLNRWVFVSGKEKKQIAIGGEIIDVTPAVAPLEEIHRWPGFGKVIQWEDDSKERYFRFHDTLMEHVKEDESELLGRLVLLTKKLILLFCINEKLDSVPLRIVERVESMLDYLLRTYAIPAGQIGSRREYEIVQDVRDIISRSKHKDGATLREIKKMLERKKHPIQLGQQVIKYMVEMGEIAPIESQGSRGPKTVRYRFVV